MGKRRVNLMELKCWADTSALLHQSLINSTTKIAISSITLKELENIKSNSKDGDIKF